MTMRLLMAAFATSGLMLGMTSCGGPRTSQPNDQPAIVDSASEPGPADADAPETFTTTSSGLQYRVLRSAAGRRPAASDTVTVHYKGWLDNGTVFDSSYQRRSPAKFPLNGVVAGWTEGLQHVPEGGMIELRIPSELGYGERGQPPTIPPNATLHFLVELIKIH